MADQINNTLPLKRLGQIDIGRFTLIDRDVIFVDNPQRVICIMCNDNSLAAGEGGAFTVEQLEKVIGDFYYKHF
jgi:hypothetical protein